MTFYLQLKYVMKDLQSALESDSYSDDDGSFDGSFYQAANPHPDDSEQTTSSSMAMNQSDQMHAMKISSCTESIKLHEDRDMLLVKCPMCYGKYYITEIEERLDICADNAVEFPDPFALDNLSTCSVIEESNSHQM